MKRSEINSAIRFAKEVLSAKNVRLPRYAYWSTTDWHSAGADFEQVVLNELGWAVTDFGSGVFDRIGTTMFDLRNGKPNSVTQGTLYGEKILLLKPGQQVPMHRHFQKTEDIINRFGGKLCLKLYVLGENNEVDEHIEGTVYCDGIKRDFSPGAVLELDPGESITITPKIFHSLWAREDCGVVIGGEVTTVCDPHRDNFFPGVFERFMEIEEDEEAEHLLNVEYPLIGSS